jgi:hypothetical protein
MNIDPRFDVYRPFDNPSSMVVVATGVIDGKMRTMGLEVNSRDPAYSLDESELRAKLEPMLREWWGDELSKAR